MYFAQLCQGISIHCTHAHTHTHKHAHKCTHKHTHKTHTHAHTTPPTHNPPTHTDDAGLHKLALLEVRVRLPIQSPEVGSEGCPAHCSPGGGAAGGQQEPE